MTIKKRQYAYHVKELQDGKGSKMFTEIGVAYLTKDGVNVILNALPADGKLFICDKKRKEIGNEL
jgi:hypothetical protein